MRSRSLAKVMVSISMVLFLAAIGSTLDLPGFEGLVEEPDPTLLAQQARLASSRPERQNLAAFSTSRDVFEQAIAPAFERAWEADHGERVEVIGWYRGSRIQARAIAAGFDADVAVLAWEPDMELLVEHGLVNPGWRQQPDGGMIGSTTVVAAVRPHNPLGIRSWGDLARPEVALLAPDPQTSGAGASILLSAYGAALRGWASPSFEGDPQATCGFVSALYGQVRVLDEDAEESLQSFEQGIGDAALTTRQELTTARRRGQSWEAVELPASVVIEHPAAVIAVNAQRHGTLELAEAFLGFLRTPQARQALAEAGFGPPHAVPAQPPAPGTAVSPDHFTVADLGGWDRVAALLSCPEGAPATGQGAEADGHPTVSSLPPGAGWPAPDKPEPQ